MSDAQSQQDNEGEKLDLLNMKIEHINLVATTRYKTDDDICSLCKNPLSHPSVEAASRFKPSSDVSLGKCGHAFHHECIDTYLATQGGMCPICNKSFNYQTKKLDNPDALKHLRVRKRRAVKKN